MVFVVEAATLFHASDIEFPGFADCTQQSWAALDSLKSQPSIPKDASLRLGEPRLHSCFSPFAHTEKTFVYSRLVIGCFENMSHCVRCRGWGRLRDAVSPLSPLVICPAAPQQPEQLTAATAVQRLPCSHSHSPQLPTSRYRGSSLAQQAPVRLSSVSSHDSGFISQDAFQSKSLSPCRPRLPTR